MADLSIRNALTTVERALQSTIRREYQKTITVADIAALRAATTQGASSPALEDFGTRFVTSAGVRYEWSKYTTTADNGSSVIKPTDVNVSKPGRWLSTSSDTSTGYLKRVVLWNGESNDKFQQFIYAQRPCVAIVWEGSKNEQRSTIAGAIYDYPCSFSIWAVSQNLRPEQQAMYGGGISSEESADPGAIKILGDVKKVLADANKLEPKLGQAGIKMIQLGEEAVEDIGLQERFAILSLGVEVLTAVANPDDDDEHEDLDALDVQPQLTDLHGEAEYDPDNFVVSGYRVEIGGGLTATPTAGSAYIAGVLVSSSPAAHTFDASSDTYRDLKTDGTFRYQAVGNGISAPDVNDGELRVGVTVTDEIGIVSDAYLVSTSANFGDVIEIPTP